MVWIGRSDSGMSACQAPPTISQEVAQLLKRLNPPVHTERRGAGRNPIPYLFELSAVPGEVPAELELDFVVVGKDISERGIGFYHEKPIPYRRGLLAIDLPGDGLVRIEVDLLWCRFTSLGWYESGGRLLGLTSGDWLGSKAG